MLQGLLAAVLNSAEVLLIRNTFSKNKIKSEQFAGLSFIAAFVLLALFSPFFFTFPNYTKMGFIGFVGIIFTGFLYNILYYKGLKRVSVEKVEPLILSSFVFSVLISVFVFPDERNAIHVTLALFAIGVVILAHLRDSRITFGFYEILLLVSAFLVGVHNVFAKLALESFSPYMLLMYRSFFLAILFGVFYKKKEVIKPKVMNYALTLNVVVVLQNVLIYWSYASIGIVMTSLLLSSAPLFALLGARIFLKEELHWRFIVTTVVVASCIIVAAFF